MKKISKNNFNNLVHRRLSEIIVFESKDPRFKRVTISRVEAEPNLSSAKVHVAIFPSEQQEELIESLNRAAGFFSRQLGNILKTRNTPRLFFVYDTGYDHSDKIEKLLSRILPKNNKPTKIFRKIISSEMG